LSFSGQRRFVRLSLRASVVDVPVNTVATYVPYPLASNVFNKEIGYFTGTATVEAYAKEATEGRLLWEAVDKRGGTTSMA
jgi:hypothetical protein